MAQNYGLGRGLSSLIPQKKISSQGDNASPLYRTDDSREENFSKDKKKENYNSFNIEDLKSAQTPRRDDIDKENTQKPGTATINITEIIANPYQPRINFDQEKIIELSNSIKSHGIIQPLLVSRKENGFELIAGERRLQAAKLAGIEKVPVIIKNVNKKEKLELAIVENIQRHDLNPMEEAKSYHRLIDEFNMSQEDVAKNMGKSRSLIANKVRLLSLPIDAMKALNEERITEGHAKAILSLPDKDNQIALLELILKNKLTVRQTENKAKEVSVRPHKRNTAIDPELRDLEDRFSSSLGTKVKIKRMGGSGGKVTIDYYSKEELDRIVSKIGS